jgi:hypothetical protein
MDVSDRCVAPGLPSALETAIRSDVHGALQAIQTLGGKFVVNDSPWWAVRAKGGATRTTMNSAHFLSKKFQAELRSRGWDTDFDIEEQEIDAFKSFSVRFEGYYLDDAGLRAVVDEYWNDRASFLPLISAFWPFVTEDPSFDQVAWWVSQMYHKRRIHDLSLMPDRLHRYFTSTGTVDHVIRVAVEFESGYTASAYRAFVKLNALYALGLVDVGVFVATDKANAIRIWPASTRNVNYDELSNRQYKRNLYFPAWEVLFRPDSYSTDVGYLGSDGTLYRPIATGSMFIHEGTEKRLYSWDGSQLVCNE